MADTAVQERLPELRDYARMVVCFHEAGHAVALWEAGIAVDALSVQNGWFSASATGLTSVKPGQYYDFEDREAMLAGLIGILAGRVAHERYEIEVGCTKHEAGVSAEAGCESDMEEFHLLAPQAGLTFNYVLARTHILVEARWAKICEVAYILYARGRVSGRVAK